MKKYIIALLQISLCLIITTSCTNDFLDAQQEGVIGEDNFWKTESDAIMAANSLYELTAEEQMYGRGPFWYINASDDMITGRVNDQADRIKNFKITGDEGYLNKIWSLHYTVIKRANDIIRRVPKMNIDSKIKNRTLGEAYFMAGLMYFELAYHYGNDVSGGVPIMDPENPLDYNKPRPSSVVENYAYCIELFTKASELLNDFSTYNSLDYGRAHKTAAYAYKAKTYLYWAKYDPSKYNDAVLTSDLVINSGQHALVKDLNPAKAFRTLFSSSSNWSSEYIWSCVSNTQAGSFLPGAMLENKGWGKYNGWGYYQPTKELFDEYEPNDARRDVTIFKDGTNFNYFGENFTWYQTSNNISGYMFGKYIEPFSDKARVNPNGDNPTTDLNIPLMRYAEVLLIKSEALIAAGKNGDQPLNEVRQRAGLAPISEATMSDLKHERRCELAGEFSDRHFDLVRWGDAQATYAKPLHGIIKNSNGTFTTKEVWPARPQFDPNIHNVWPIPPFEVSGSKGVLTQNKGW